MQGLRRAKAKGRSTHQRDTLGAERDELLADIERWSPAPRAQGPGDLTVRHYMKAHPELSRSTAERLLLDLVRAGRLVRERIITSDTHRQAWAFRRASGTEEEI